MPEQTGSRNDLRIEHSRCLPIRFSDSICRKCVDICPRKAISVGKGLHIDAELCSGCLLCTTVCPSGALELSTNFLTSVAQLSKVPEPLLGCIRTQEQANGWLACLGGLSDEHLLYLSHRLTGKLTLNTSRCADCPNNSMLPHLLTRLENLEAGGTCSISAVNNTEALHHSDESVDRRSFFRSFRTSLFQTAAVVMGNGTEETECRSDYATKRAPARRKLLQLILKKADDQTRKQIENHFFGRITFNNSCTACQACAAICPTGALTVGNRSNHPDFKGEPCTACGLCVEFCMDKGVELEICGDSQPPANGQPAEYVCSPPEIPDL